MDLAIVALAQAGRPAGVAFGFAEIEQLFGGHEVIALLRKGLEDGRQGRRGVPGPHVKEDYVPRFHLLGHALDHSVNGRRRVGPVLDVQTGEEIDRVASRKEHLVQPRPLGVGG